MAWISRGRRALALSVVAGASAVAFAVSKTKKLELEADESAAQTQPPVGASFSSSLPLGKVLASWTTNFEPTFKWDDNWDRCKPSELTKPSKTVKEEKDEVNELIKAKPTATRHIILIRHGQYEEAPDEDSGRILTELGREQARMTGKRLKEFSEKYKYTKVINSTMTRAIETADLISEYLPDVPRDSCDLLREGAPIPPEPPIGHWRPNSAFYKDGARIEAAFRKYFHRASASQTEDSYEVLVCHANVIRYCVCRALQVPPEAWLRMSLANGSITLVSIRPNGRVSLRGLGDAGHIPCDKISFHQ